MKRLPKSQVPKARSKAWALCASCLVLMFVLGLPTLGVLAESRPLASSPGDIESSVGGAAKLSAVMQPTGLPRSTPATLVFVTRLIPIPLTRAPASTSTPKPTTTPAPVLVTPETPTRKPSPAPVVSTPATSTHTRTPIPPTPTAKPAPPATVTRAVVPPTFTAAATLAASPQPKTSAGRGQSCCPTFAVVGLLPLGLALHASLRKRR
jgi:hypothetical protein